MAVPGSAWPGPVRAATP